MTRPAAILLCEAAARAARNFFTISGVRSVEPSSTTMISRSSRKILLQRAQTIACSIEASYYYVSISTLTKLLPITAPEKS